MRTYRKDLIFIFRIRERSPKGVIRANPCGLSRGYPMCQMSSCTILDSLNLMQLLFQPQKDDQLLAGSDQLQAVAPSVASPACPSTPTPGFPCWSLRTHSLNTHVQPEVWGIYLIAQEVKHWQVKQEGSWTKLSFFPNPNDCPRRS